MIKHLTVSNLNNFTNFDNSFHPDVNVLTGENGAGKTSVLRLAWYLTSANIERIFDDCSFDFLKIQTDKFTLSFDVKKSKYPKTISEVHVEYLDGTPKKYKKTIKLSPISSFKREIEEINQRTLGFDGVRMEGSPTVMFPTFRRMEGGYSYLRQCVKGDGGFNEPEYGARLDSSLESLSSRLGVFTHKFVASISTSDIRQILIQKYAEISKKTNEKHAALAREIAEIVTKYQSIKEKKKDEGSYLSKISNLVDNNQKEQEKSLAPFNALSDIVGEFFASKSIEIAPGIVFGDLSDQSFKLDSDLLSAGEKQFLGFIAYNAIVENGILFIDEPEISLHLDWQRRLIPTLQAQNADNQIIMATHSPFIYSMYEDKELRFKRNNK